MPRFDYSGETDRFDMIAALSLLLLCQLAGEIAVGAFGLPLPGPVVGLVLLFGLLLSRDRFKALAHGPLQKNAVEGAAKGILSHLSLLFIPAGVGVIQQLDVVADHGAATTILLAVSVIVTLLMTVAAFLATEKIIARLRQ
jgi:holin-like protein